MIYFDNAASTPLCNAAREILLQDFANPSSPHALGLESERSIKNAAKDIASIISVKSNEIIFTSGGTESNNLGILGAAFALKSAKGAKSIVKIKVGKLEHPSVIEPIKYLESLSGFSIVDENEEADLICQSQVSSETGDIIEIKKKPNSILFVDGAQAFCKMRPPIGADIYSFSGHKIHGPMGIGGLVIKTGVRIKPQGFGGGQQRGIRPGTENVSGIVAMTAAAKSFVSLEKCYETTSKIKDIMQTLCNEIPNTYVNQLTREASPYILSLSFPGLRGETLTNLLSAKGLYVSMGTACQTTKKDRALSSLFGKERAESAIRLSFSYQNTDDEAYEAKKIIKAAVAELRKN